MKTLFRGGYIYSPVAEATALLVEDDRIVWVGDEAAAEVYLDSNTAVLELAGAFVAPPFIDGAVVGESLLGCSVGVRFPGDVVTGADSSRPPVLYLHEEPDPQLVVDLLENHRSGVGGTAVCLNPALAQTAKALAKAGIPFCFGSWGDSVSPWEWISLATGTAERPGLTERAAFLAATRGPLRVFPDIDWQTRAQLDGGAPANFAIWQADHIDVRSADPRIAAWSTDPRSGVPGLPQIGQEEPWPMLVSRYEAGQLQEHTRTISANQASELGAGE